MKNRGTYIPTILMMASSALWGASFIFTKALFLNEASITPLIILTFRMLIASGITVPFLLITHKLEPIKKGHLKYFLLLALAEPFLYSICETSGLEYVSGSLASIIIATIPLFIPFGMAAAYGEKLKVNIMIGIILSLAGIAVMSLYDDFSLSANWLGLLLLTGSVVIAVVYTLLLVKVLGQYKPFTITAYQNLIALFYFLPVMLAFDAPNVGGLSFSPHMIMDFCFLGILCSTVAYIFYNYSMQRLGPTATSLYTNSIPVFSLLLAVAIGQERLTPIKVIGMAVVLVGLTVAQRKPKASNN